MPVDSELRTLFDVDPAACERRARRAIVDASGCVPLAARSLRMSVPNLWHYLRKLGITSYPAAVRVHFREHRYRFACAPPKS